VWYTPHMPRRFQSFFWRTLDQVMPDGPPVFLAWVILMLLIVSGIIAVRLPQLKWASPQSRMAPSSAAAVGPFTFGDPG
jgi:hypothetical protein